MFPVFVVFFPGAGGVPAPEKKTERTGKKGGGKERMGNSKRETKRRKERRANGERETGRRKERMIKGKRERGRRKERMGNG